MAPPRNTSVRYPGGWKAAWGALGFVAVYALLFPIAVWQRETLIANLTLELGGGVGETPLSEFVEVGQLADWEIAGLLLYNSHLVPIDVPVQVFEASASGETVNLIFHAGGPFLLLLAVPVVVFSLTGMLAVNHASGSSLSNRRYGAMLQFTGVVPLAIATVFLFGFSTQSGTGGPSLLWGPVLAGVLYPVVGGYVGATLAATFDDESDSADATTESRWG